jgi:PEP-CTERM motif-containing protein
MHNVLSSLSRAVLVGAAVFAGASEAWAGTPLPPSIPEPTTLGLIAAGIAAAAIGARFRKRK